MEQILDSSAVALTFLAMTSLDDLAGTLCTLSGCFPSDPGDWGYQVRVLIRVCAAFTRAARLGRTCGGRSQHGQGCTAYGIRTQFGMAVAH